MPLEPPNKTVIHKQVLQRRSQQLSSEFPRENHCLHLHFIRALCIASAAIAVNGCSFSTQSDHNGEASNAPGNAYGDSGGASSDNDHGEADKTWAAGSGAANPDAGIGPQLQDASTPDSSGMADVHMPADAGVCLALGDPCSLSGPSCCLGLACGTSTGMSVCIAEGSAADADSPACRKLGQPCSGDLTCCQGLYCIDSICLPATSSTAYGGDGGCSQAYQPCAADPDCCDDLHCESYGSWSACVDGTPQPSQASCIPLGQPCDSTLPCCKGLSCLPDSSAQLLCLWSEDP